MVENVRVADLQVAPALYEFTTSEALSGTGVDPDKFWAGLAELLAELTGRNRQLLAVRDELQTQLDAYHREHPGIPDPQSYEDFLRSIGYLRSEPGDFDITTSHVDPEITQQSGPQLIVPLLNARFATNAANARWGSLYDALYGTDMFPDEGELARGTAYNPHRGEQVIAFGRRLLDEHFPLAGASHADVDAYQAVDGALMSDVAGTQIALAEPGQFVGYRGEPDRPSALLLRHHGLHVEIDVDRDDPIGASDRAGVRDLLLESAVTTIMDLEDSVAAVDAEDKVLGYRNWLRLMQGRLDADVTKDGRSFVRAMNRDRSYTAPDGTDFALPGRALLFVRNVGHLMTTDAVLDPNGDEVPEGILDAVFTTLGAMHDLRAGNAGDGLRNSRAGSVYIVKPKIHGPDEVAFTVDLFDRVERLLGLPAGTVKVGIMDEERRTTVNLKACVYAARDRVVFINTGFLDRTGDEIHSSMLAGPFGRKAELRTQPYLTAYEDSNVDVGLATGFAGRAQIGKGMWTMPDLMAAMVEQKIGHPRAGASTAWVPSPTAATLHAVHYHQVDVAAVQRELIGRPPRPLRDLLTIPLAGNPAALTEDERRAETDNNLQSILGYVVRWIDQGVGCSKVPDLSDTALMEDRATLRISSQLLANWLEHGLITEADVDSGLRRVAPLVDRQNAGDPAYQPLVGPEGPGLAYRTARDLVLLGAEQPSGYTEPLLHQARRRSKQLVADGVSHRDAGMLGI